MIWRVSTTSGVVKGSRGKAGRLGNFHGVLWLRNWNSHLSHHFYLEYSGFRGASYVIFQVSVSSFFHIFSRSCFLMFHIHCWFNCLTKTVGIQGIWVLRSGSLHPLNDLLGTVRQGRRRAHHGHALVIPTEKDLHPAADLEIISGRSIKNPQVLSQNAICFFLSLPTFRYIS